MITDEDKHWLYEKFAQILTAAVDRDADGVASGLGEVALRLDHDGVYSICCALAETVHKLAFPDFVQGDGSLTGDMAVVDKLSDDADRPPSLWAVRFVVAYMNGDRDTTLALFWGPLQDDNPAVPAEDILIPGVSALINMAADITRLKEAEL